MSKPKCRFCSAPLSHVFVDLGMSPLSNAFLEADQVEQVERFYPLRVYVCEECYLVQLAEFESPEEIFGDYVYFSSYSDSWLEHAKTYAEHMVAENGLDDESLVVEVASNDGYLLQYFQNSGVPVLGIEPARNVAAVAQAAGITTVVKFFGVQTALELANAGQQADLLIGNNVLGHVPDLNDFVSGLRILLKPHGLITMEFPHLLRLMRGNQFDTIYHEHFSYWSFLAVEKVFAAHGLTISDVEEIPTHGGSLRIFAQHTGSGMREVSTRVTTLREVEIEAGLSHVESYLGFKEQVNKTKYQLLKFLIEAKESGKSVAAYGAPAKGNTLLNYCGVREDLLPYTVDRSPHKQGRFLPGTHIPIYSPDRIRETQPDYLLILPWNLKTEVMEQMAYVREWGCQFVAPIPELEVLD